MKSNWNELCQFLPAGWTKKARELGAFTRGRNISSPKKLLRLMLIHLADNKSLRMTVAIAKEGGICDISDVALLKRLRKSSEWFRWISTELIKRKGIELRVPLWLKKYNIKSVDASVISEQGSKGTDWRLHYCISLFDLKCDQFIITNPKIGESLTNFKISKGDLIIGDRAYGRLRSMKYVLENEADFLTRVKGKAFDIYQEEKKVELLTLLSELKTSGQYGDWNIQAKMDTGEFITLRLCAIRKSELEIEKSQKKEKRKASKKQYKLTDSTLELCKYVVVATSLTDSNIKTYKILELFRFRWQIEISFKRLKSILGLGNLPKYDELSCKAWLEGKMLVALLSQAIVDEGRHFSPWGVRTRQR